LQFLPVEKLGKTSSAQLVSAIEVVEKLANFAHFFAAQTGGWEYDDGSEKTLVNQDIISIIKWR